MKPYLLLLAFAALLTGGLQAQEQSAGQSQADNLFKQLLAAQLSSDYDSFVANGTVDLKAALSKTQFQASSDIMKARLKVGYDLTPLGDLNKKGYEIYLYRLRFKDGSDDM